MPIINEGRVAETLIQSERGARRQLGNKTCPQIRERRLQAGRRRQQKHRKQEPGAPLGKTASALRLSSQEPLSR